MAEELRALFNEQFMKKLCRELKENDPLFNQEEFLSSVYAKDWDELALKQRVRRITLSLSQSLPRDFGEAVALLKKVAPSFQGSLGGIIFPDYVEINGLHSWGKSMEALEYFTVFSTSEFAVRPFVMENQDKMMAQFLEWSSHENEHVRRLASEGSRPRLPWGIALTNLKKDPSPIFSILENLKEDPSLYVRKSVANNINDISKDHPELVLNLAKKWHGTNDRTNWIVKTGLRTLLKKGVPEALELFGLQKNEHIKVTNLAVTKNVVIGEAISISFHVTSKDTETRKLRLEYAIDFVKANGKHSTKQFKISETSILPGEEKVYTKTHSFRDLSTRKHYSGKHVLHIIVNGEAKAQEEFEVMKRKQEE
jgi:3-methyladenine DNA glycosylase AlkC